MKATRSLRSHTKLTCARFTQVIVKQDRPLRKTIPRNVSLSSAGKGAVRAIAGKSVGIDPIVEDG